MAPFDTRPVSFFTAQTTAFLFTTAREMRHAGLSHLDVIPLRGDAYADHPSFASAMIGRALEAAGFSVGIIAQPDWKPGDDFR